MKYEMLTLDAVFVPRRNKKNSVFQVMSVKILG